MPQDARTKPSIRPFLPIEVTNFPSGIKGCLFDTLQDPQPANVKLIIEIEKIIKKERFFIIGLFCELYKNNSLD